MSSADVAFWTAAHNIAANAAPDVIAALLASFKAIRGMITDAEIAKLVSRGELEVMLAMLLSDATLNKAFMPVQIRLRQAAERSFAYFRRTTPNAGMIDGRIVVRFDYLNPKVVDAIRTMEQTVMTTLKSDIRQTVRQVVEQGLRDGANPREIGTELRDVIGLSPTQQQYIANLRAELESGDIASAARRKLLDKRFKLDSLTPEKIDRIVARYEKSYRAFNAETNARTASLQAMKTGQRLSWDSAIQNGLVDRSKLYRRWKGVMDSREREEHVALEGDTQHYDVPHSNGEMIPGESTYNCRCLDVYFVAA